MKYALYRKFDELLQFIDDRCITISGYDDAPISIVRALCDIVEDMYGRDYKGGQ